MLTDKDSQRGKARRRERRGGKGKQGGGTEEGEETCGVAVWLREGRGEGERAREIEKVSR